MHADVPNHEPSLMLMNCGEARLIRPSIGSWVTYGLGTREPEPARLHRHVPRRLSRSQESQNWQSAFLPGVYQGTYIDTQHTDIEKLIENIRNRASASPEQRRAARPAAAAQPAAPANGAGSEAELEARIQSFELAYRMQIGGGRRLRRQPRAASTIRDMYGPGVQARQLLIARRLLERGVRFVQVWHGEGQPWDNHDDIEADHRRLAKQCDQADRRACSRT